ncbi:hypothetical protein LSCM1_02276 [Leishmania martiniquensis]|uniref:Flagellar attachment zone protein 1 conserved domain-containing protein n=1 Tax=Leishmania martiniquensis TaxID=1580590 RepID=A0A836FSA8_9TRYP|nr:hypothetical protein LSCM1_02276 [Leishmania martiniquensis]
MTPIPLEGSVVSYEFLDAKRNWLWGIGRVTCADGRVCVIREWVGALVDKASIAKLESEAAASKVEAKNYQARLLAIRERIDSQNPETSEEEKKRTSQELSECLAIIGKHRNHSRSLLADVERMKASSTLDVNVQQFTPASSSVAILCSSILQVISQKKISSLFLSSEELDSIEKAATRSRSQLNDELVELRATYQAADIEITDLRLQIRALEEQLKLLGNVTRPAQLSEECECGSLLQEKQEGLETWEFEQLWDKSVALVVTDHAITFPWNDGDTLLRHKPEETKSIFAAEAAFACRVPIQCVTNLKLRACGSHLSAMFSVNHPASVAPKEIDARIAKYAFPSIHRLHEEPTGTKSGLDRAIEDLEHAFGIPTGKHEGFYFDEFIESMPDTAFSNDRDAYESEIGDLLMLLDKLNNENRSLQYTLDKSAAELKKQMTVAQKEHDERKTEISRLRDIVAKLKDLADQQEKELEGNRLHSQLVQQARFRHNLVLTADTTQASLYAVTIDEYLHQKGVADGAQAALLEEKSKTEEMSYRLKEYEQQCAQHIGHIRNLQNTAAAREKTSHEDLCALEGELIDIFMQLTTSETTVKALSSLTEKQLAELRSFRAKRNSALAEREAAEALTVHNHHTAPETASQQPIPPETIDIEPLYSITMHEYLEVVQSNLSTLCQLKACEDQNKRLAEEVAAFRANRNAALAARDAEGTLPVVAKPLSAEEAAARALDPQEIADGPLYAVTLEEYRDRDSALGQLAAELEAQRAAAQALAEEVAAFRANRNAALAVRDAEGTLPVVAKPLSAEEAAARALDPQEIADGPLYAVTLEELQQVREDATQSVEVGDENGAALEAELLDLLTQLKAVQGQNAALVALCERKDATVADLEKHDVRANNSDKSKPQTSSRHKKVFEGDDWDTVVRTKPHALHDAFVMDVCAACRVCREDLSAVTFALGSLQASVTVMHNSDISSDDIAKLVEEYHYPNMWSLYARRLAPKDGLDEAEGALSTLESALAAQKLETQALAEEVAAFRANRNAALAARDAEGTLPVVAKPLSAEEAAARALDPQEIADGPLYAVTLEEYRDRDSALGQLAAELEAQRAAAQALAEEVAAFRANRNAALAARDAEGTLPVVAKPLSAEEAAARALDPQEIADGPLYAVTLEEYRDRDSALGQLAAELEAQRAAAQALAEEVAAFRANRNAALAVRDAEGTLPVVAKPLSAEEAAARALDPQEIADGPLYAVTLEELQQVREDATQSVEVGDENGAALEAELLDLLTQLKAVQGQNAALVALCERKDATVADLEKHDVRANNSDKSKPQTSSRHKKVFEGDDWDTVVRTKPHALHDAFVMDVCAACRVCREDLSAVTFALGSLQASVTVMHNSDISSDDIAKLVEEYHYPNMWSLYARRLAPKDGLDEAEGALSTLESALAAQKLETQALAEEVAAFRANRNAALAARDAEGTLPVVAKPLSAEEAAARALDPQEIADGPLYAVTLEEYRDRDSALGQLAAELEAQRAAAQALAEEVAAFRANRNAALAVRDAEGTLPVVAKPLSAEEAAARALDPQEIADGPLYAVTLEEYRDRDSALGQLAAELEAQRAAAQALAEEVAAFRANRNAALAVRDAEGTLPVVAKPLSAEEAAARALDPQEIADGPLYAVTLEEYRDRDSALGQLAAELEAQRAAAQALAEEVAAFRANRNAALAARDAEGTLPVVAKPLSAEEAAARALDPQEIADGPLYAVTLEELQQVREDATQSVEVGDENGAALEAELLDLLTQLKAVQGQNAALVALCERKDATVADLEKHDVRANNSDKSKPQTSSRHKKVFEGDDWDTVVRTKPHALHDAFVMDVCAACRVCREDLSAVTFALGSLQASVTVMHNSDISSDDIAKLVEEYHYPNMWSLYARRLAPKDGLDEAEGALSTLESALAAQKLETQALAEEVAAFRANRNAALAARDAEGTLPVVAKPLSAEEAAARALDPQEIADGPLYAVTLEEYRDRDSALGQLAAELEAQRAAAQALAEEVAAFRANRNAALAVRDAEGTLPVVAKPLSAEEAAARALDPQEIADGPLYAVTLEEYRDRDSALGQLAAELEAQRAAAQALAEEVAAFRANRNAALAVRDAEGTLPVVAKPLSAEEAAARALDPQEIADGPLYAVTLEEYRDRDSALGQLAAELEAQRAAAQALAEEVAAFRANRNAALAARDAEGTLPVVAKPLSAEEAAARALDPQEIADGPLYAVTLEEYRDRDSALGQLAAELEAQRAAAQALAEEVAAFRANRNAALAVRDAEGTLPVVAKPLSAEEAAARALDPQEIADGPLYAVTLEEYRDRDSALGQLAAELEAQRAAAQALAEEVAAFRANRNAALAVRDAEGTLPVVAKPLSAEEAAARALDPQEIADGPLYAVTLEEYRDRDSALGQLAAELEAQRAAAQALAEEVAAFRANRNAALAARDAEGTLPVVAKPLSAEEAAARALDPQEIADGPLYAVTLEEYRDRDSALGQLAAELEAQRAAAQALAEEVAAFRANRNAALAVRDAEGTLPVVAKPLSAEEAAARALDPQEIADGPLYAVTLEEYRDRDSALGQLAAELEAQRAAAQALAEEVAAFRANRNAALAVRDAEGTLPVVAKPLSAEEAAARALDPQEIADGPLYAVTLEELQQVREDATQSVEVGDENGAALEAELLDLLTQLKAVQGQNAALVALCERKDATVADLEKHDVRANNSDKSKPQTSSRHKKVFEGDDWDTVVRTKPHALHDAFVMDVCAACRVCREDLSAVTFALGSLQASVTVMHNSDISSDDIAKLVEEYHYPNMWSLYARRLAPKDGLDEAEGALSTLESALAAQKLETQALAEEVAAFRANRNAALAARDAEGTLPVVAKPLSAEEAAARALDPQEIADGPLYAVTLEEYRDRDSALGQLAAELEAQRAAAQALAEEVAAFRANRNAALAVRDAEGTLPVVAKPLSAEEAAARALDPQEIADGPLYAVTLEEYRDRDSALGQLAAELEAQRAAAQALAEEVAAFRANRNAALAVRDAEGTLPVVAKPLSAEEAAARALDPQEIADGPLYAVTLEEYRDRDSALGQLAAELEAQRAAAQALAEEVAAFRANRNAALAARDAEGTLPVVAKPLSAEEAAARALDPQEIADGPLYAVTLEEYRDRDSALGQLAAELEAQRAAAQALAEEVAAFRANRNAALAVRDAEGTLPVVAKPLSAEEAAARALDPQEIADGPLYAVTLEEYRDRDSALGQLAAELEAQRAAAQALAEEVAAFRANRNAALAVRDAEGTLPVVAKPLSAEEAAARALDPQEIADGPLYAVTLEEYRDRDSALGQLAAELEAQRAAAQALAEEVAAFRANRNAALAARDAEGTLPVVAKPLSAEEAAARALDPQEIADGPLYAVTLEEYRDRDSALGQLAAELEAQRAAAQALAEEVAAFRANRNAALAVRDAEGTLPVVAKPLSAEEAAARALDPQEIADGPLYAVTLEELQQVREDATQSVEVGDENGAALEAELLDLLTQLKAVQGQNAALVALCERKDATVADLEKHDVRANNSDKSKPQTSSRHKKVFEGDDWDTVVRTKPHALHDAFVMDVCAACRVCREDLSAVTFALGSLQASVTVMHNSDISSDDIAKLVEEYHYPNMWSLYARRLAPKDGLDEAEGALSTLESALAAQKLETQALAEEVAAFRANRNAALAARDAEGTLPVVAKPLSAEEAAARALDPQEIADGPLYAVTLEEYRDRDSALGQLAAELEAQRAAAQALAEEVAAFRANRNAALAARDAEGTLPVVAKPLSAEEAAARALDPQEIADGPLYAVTLEEYRDKNSELKCLTASPGGKQAEKTCAVILGSDADREAFGKLLAEVSAFRRKRIETLACRQAYFTSAEGVEVVDGLSEGADVPVPPAIIDEEPLFCVMLEELRRQRELNAEMRVNMGALAERIRATVDPELLVGDVGEDVVSYLEALLKALEESRGAERAARDLAEERGYELSQMQKVFKNEEERLNSDLEDAREEVERLQRELDLLTDKLDEACRLFGDADAVNAEGVAKLEAFADVLAAARDAEKEAMEQLEAKESELEELRTVLKATVAREEALESLEDEVSLLQKEKEIIETELGAAQKEISDLRHDLRAAEDRAEDKAREVDRMALDLDTLNIRIKDLVEELQEKTDQYNQVIKDLDDFARDQSRGDEKELLQRLAAREQELFELLEARRGENDEHEKQVGVLQDQINRLRDQTDQDNTLHNGLQDELARLRKLLADRESALREKTAENESLRDDIEGMIDEHEVQIREMELELEGKSKEVSDALERLEEMSSMVQEAREGEESALRLRADSDAEVFRLQKELDKVKQLQSAMAESEDDNGRLLAQMLDTEGQLRVAEATIRKKDAEVAEAEKGWRAKLNEAESLNLDLRRLLKRTMAALSKSRDTMGSSAGALDAFRDELKPMLQ